MNILDYMSPTRDQGMSRAEQIACQIEVLISELASEPGTCLGTKESLRRQFDVSLGTMNEAVRILEVQDIIVMRRGSKGGIFVGAAQAQLPLSPIKLGMERLKHDKATLAEQCRVVSNQLEPLVFVEATKAANLAAVAELQHLAQKLSAAFDKPAESLSWSRLLYRHIAEMGINTVLTRVYTTLLNIIE